MSRTISRKVALKTVKEIFNLVPGKFISGNATYMERQAVNSHGRLRSGFMGGEHMMMDWQVEGIEIRFVVGCVSFMRRRNPDE